MNKRTRGSGSGSGSGISLRASETFNIIGETRTHLGPIFSGAFFG